MSRPLRYGLLILMLLLLASIPLAMQFQAGSIEGVIMNDYDPIAKVSVEARNVNNGSAFRAESDAAGHFKLKRLPPGRYSLLVGVPGHDSMWIRQVIMERGQTIESDIHFAKSPMANSRL